MKGYNKNLCVCLLALGIIFAERTSSSQPLPAGYEVRYYSKDPRANGETDFKGETSTLNTGQRLQFLQYYADQVSAFYGDRELDTRVVRDREAVDLLKSIKPQPLPSIRKRVILDQWKWTSSKQGKHEESVRKLAKYKGARDMLIKQGTLHFQGGAEWKWDLPVQTWRFSIQWKARLLEDTAAAEFSLLDQGGRKTLVKMEVNKSSFSYYSRGQKTEGSGCKPYVWQDIRVEVDLAGPGGEAHYTVLINGERVADYVAAHEAALLVDGLRIKTRGNMEVDELYGVGYHQTSDAAQPFYPKTFLDERFDVEPSTAGWQGEWYDDGCWPITDLPHAVGSERYEGEDLFLRKTVKIEHLTRAYLNIETLDPGGEIWINGRMAALIKDRYPIRLEVTDYLNPHSENLFAIKVNAFYLTPDQGTVYSHSYLDLNYGWFAGRAFLDLVAETFVQDAFFYTKSILADRAAVHADIRLEHKGTLGFKGKIRIKMKGWEDQGQAEKSPAVELPVLIGPGIKEFSMDWTMENPRLWSPASPSLYQVLVEVEDRDGAVIDDYVLTTGIRTVSQEGGAFRLNGESALLNGAQIFGFRGPIENMATWLRCPPDPWIAEEMLMIRRMNGNMLRMHVHGWKDYAVGVNDERYCELADQMGIMLIWCTPAWRREGDWGQIDFAGYHKYMQQVRNHPSIVMWEVSNHPNTFKKHENYESDLFCEASYQAVHPYDPSRLISLTSHIGHLHYGNDEGTIDQSGGQLTAARIAVVDVNNQDALTGYGTLKTFTGDTLVPAKAWTAPMVTRGNQDAATGYGAEWSQLRLWPGAYRQNFLDSKERAYFNFEHQESIAQPNWNLCKGKPWYHLQSYEWAYDEGSIGRKLSVEEWRESQAWQAFSAYEAIKKMRKLGYDGFSWCCLHDGANAVTYKKPLIDFQGHAKLAFHIHKTVFNPVLAGSNNVDVVYGPDDRITPMILNLGEEKRVSVAVVIRDRFNGREIQKRIYRDVLLPAGRTATELSPFKPALNQEGVYWIEYRVEPVP